MSVVYDGVAGCPVGDLFQGLKIWISHRVPLRSRWVDLVEGNGGKVVPLETKADMKIADNVKRGGVLPPPGSYSYQWIEFSIKNGQLENKDDYEIGPPLGTSRQIGSAQQTRTTRTTFTVKDDLILTQWVLSKEWKGQAASGNEMYKELELLHPNHTWQSWRDRWVRKLKDRPRPSISPESLELELEQDASGAGTLIETAAASSNDAKTSNKTPTLRVRSPITRRASSERRDAQTSIPMSDTQLSTKRRMPFTEEEDQMLIAFVQEARDRGAAINGNVIYQKFAGEHPSRTWHSWRDRWVRHLSLRYDGPSNSLQWRDTTAEYVASPNREDIEGQSIIKKHTSDPLQPGIRNGSLNGIASTEKIGSGPENLSPEQKMNPRSDDERLRRQQETKLRVRAAKTLQKTWRGHSVRRGKATLEAAIVPLQTMIRGFLARQTMVSRQAKGYNLDQWTAEADLAGYSQEHEDHLDGSQHEAISPTRAMPRRDRDPMDQFYRDLETYIEGSGAVIDREPSIGGVRFDLWDLYRITTKQDCELEHRNMRIVADALGLDWRRFPGILDELQQFYRKNLADFEDAINSFDNEMLEDAALSDGEEQTIDTEREDLPESLDAVTAAKTALMGPSSPDYRSSPPVTGSKRSRQYGELLTSDPGYPSDGSRKRRRLDKSSVIPPTPEGNLRSSTERSRHLSAQNYTSPLKSRGENDELPIDISSDEESGVDIDEDGIDDHNDDQNELPSHSNWPKQNRLEPETQDWGFTPAPRASRVFDSIEADDVRPSEQLELEIKEHRRPGQHRPSKPSADAWAEDRLTSAPTITKLAEQHSTDGLRRPTRQRRATEKSSTTSPRSRVETKVKKRTLPVECRRNAPISGTRPAAPLLDPTSESQQRPQPQVPTSSKASAAAPSRTPKATRRSYSPADTPSPTTPAVNRSAPTLATCVAPSVQSGSRSSPEVYDDAYVQAQVEHFEALGYSNGHVVEAMWAAAFQRGPQNVALESLHRGLGIPQNERGVWTKKDDSDLKTIRQYEQGTLGGTDKDKMKIEMWELLNRLTRKHGEKGVNLRRQFLALTPNRGRNEKGKARAK